MASVRAQQYADGVFWQGWYNNRQGKRCGINTRIPVAGPKSKQAALEFTLNLQGQIQAGINPFRGNSLQAGSRDLFTALYDEFLAEKRLQVRAGTAGLYEQSGRVWLQTMGNCAVQEMDGRMLASFAERRLKQAGKRGRLAPETANRNLRDMKCFLRWCAARGLVTRVPRVPVVKIEKPPLQAYRPEEVIRLLAAAREVAISGVRFDLFLRVLLYSGLRLSEALSVTWDDLDTRRRVMVIGGFRTKTGRQATVPLSMPLLQALRELPRPRKGRLFPWSGTSGHLRAVWESTVRRARLRYLKLHAMRHTAARMMVDAGLKPHQLREMLHASLATTLQYYVGADREAMTDAAKRIGRSAYAMETQSNLSKSK